MCTGSGKLEFIGKQCQDLNPGNPICHYLSQPLLCFCSLRLYLHLFERVMKSGGKRDRFSICSFSEWMQWLELGLAWGWELAAASGSPLWVAGASSAALQGASAWSWVGPRTWTGLYCGLPCCRLRRSIASPQPASVESLSNACLLSCLQLL